MCNLSPGLQQDKTRWLPHVEPELLTLPEELSSPQFLVGFVLLDLFGFCVVFYRSLSTCLFSFGHCIVCPSTYGFWLPLWYLQSLLNTSVHGRMYIFFSNTYCRIKRIFSGLYLCITWTNSLTNK